MTLHLARTNHLCLTCLRTGHHANTCADITSAWHLTREVVVPDQPLQIAVGVRSHRAPVVMWPWVSVFSGMVLVAVGGVMRDPVARAVFEWIQS